ncbi:unnamed protein product [Caenorhabditis bovis]|uniref:Uncharacterized protein n=1 Tax=Caenorhabditis bovis TaxID=2654633 RepID=A0A8S1EQT9_9PELO|nr:unnamed protein product [Caenorhabditis bovis]
MQDVIEKFKESLKTAGDEKTLPSMNDSLHIIHDIIEDTPTKVIADEGFLALMAVYCYTETPMLNLAFSCADKIVDRTYDDDDGKFLRLVFQKMFTKWEESFITLGNRIRTSLKASMITTLSIELLRKFVERHSHVIEIANPTTKEDEELVENYSDALSKLLCLRITVKETAQHCESVFLIICRKLFRECHCCVPENETIERIERIMFYFKHLSSLRQTLEYDKNMKKSAEACKLLKYLMHLDCVKNVEKLGSPTTSPLNVQIHMHCEDANRLAQIKPSPGDRANPTNAESIPSEQEEATPIEASKDCGELSSSSQEVAESDQMKKRKIPMEEQLDDGPIVKLIPSFWDLPDEIVDDVVQKKNTKTRYSHEENMRLIRYVYREIQELEEKNEWVNLKSQKFFEKYVAKKYTNRTLTALVQK